MTQQDTFFGGRYEIVAKIREGGMGAVYKVRHRLLDEIRVVKVVRPQLHADAELKRRFSEEAKTATRLKHPNIATIHDYAIEEDGTAYLVMEFIEGVTLYELLRSRGPLGSPLTLEIAHQTLSALGYLHRKNVVHRDIAPDNLMLTTDEEGRPRIKLIDLGIAKVLDRPGELTSTGVFLGKLKYASPEQYGALSRGEKLDGRSDLFAFGIVLYELLTGVRPFEGETPTELMRSHVSEPPLPFSQTDPQGRVPEALRAAVLKALAKNRDERFASAEEFDRELAGLRERLYLTGDPTLVIPSLNRETPVLDVPALTPGAQDRLDRQFTGPTPARPISVESTPPSDTRTTPMGISRKPGASLRIALLLAAVALVAGAAVLFVVRSRTAGPGPGRIEPAPAAIAPTSPALTEAPVAIARPSPEPTRAVLAVEISPTAPAIPTAPPLEPTAFPSPSPAPRATPSPLAIRFRRSAVRPSATATPIPIPTPRQESRALQLAAEDARWRCAGAQSAAAEAGAVKLALEPYDRGRTLTQEANRLLATGDFAAARSSFEAARQQFDEARAAAKRLSQGPPAVSDSRGASDRDLILETVRAYVRAQDALDAALFVRIFPSVNTDRVKATWEKLSGQRVTLDVKAIDISPGGTLAEVRADQTRTVKLRSGREQRTRGEVVLMLEKRDRSWIIKSSRFKSAASEKN